MDKIHRQSYFVKTIINAIGVLVTIIIIAIVTIGCNSKSISPTSDSADSYYNRGVEYSNKGDLDKAISEYDQAIKINPDYVEVYNNRGVAYASKGDLDRAISDYDQAIRLDPNHAVA